MKQLSLVDSLFLYAEDVRMPMHIGSLYILASEDGIKEFNAEEFKEFYEKRIHLADVHRRRLIETPLNIGRPYWINDPDFNLDNHFSHVALPKGGQREDLLELAASIYNQQLDRSKPLWSSTIITGLDAIPDLPKNAFAIVSKVHHANIDGLAGVAIQQAIFDLTPIPREIPPLEEEWKPDSLEDMPAKIAKDYAKRMVEFPEKVFDYFRSTSESLASIAKSGLGMKDLSEEFFKPTAPPTIINQSVTPRKMFGVIELPMSRIKKIKNQAGVKVNDVMLAICGGGLRKYLQEKEALPDQSLVAGVPVSVRKKEQEQDKGNQVTMMQIELGTNEGDHVQRLNEIFRKTKKSKIIAKAQSVDEIAELIPSSVAAAAAKVSTRIGALSKFALLHNVIITNVPGPPLPLYINGFRILHHYGFGITMENMGLMITIYSMEDKVAITLTACKDLIPDAQNLANYIQDSTDELELALDSKAEENDLFQKLAEKHQLSSDQKKLL